MFPPATPSLSGGSIIDTGIEHKLELRGDGGEEDGGGGREAHQARQSLIEVN